MKILLCSEQILSKELGTSKVLIELAEELRILGWECKLVAPSDINCQAPGINYYTKALTSYLNEFASKFDVVDYPYFALPYPITKHHPKTLFVARSALLVHHFETTRIPLSKSWKARLGYIIKFVPRLTERNRYISQANHTMKEADLINVNNDRDKTELINRGVPAEKIVSIPLGISREQRILFNSLPERQLNKPTVVFVGTFDNRKGATDFPKIFNDILLAVPEVRFKLLGTYRTEVEVLKHFPEKLRNRIESISTFKSTEISSLLADCSVGIFPSYLEGFGLGVLEMLAASIPVIAYNAPGPPMMLPSEYLVSRGDTKNMSTKVIDLLQDRQKLANARLWAKQQSQNFCWQQIAQITSETYLKFLSFKKSNQNM